MTPSHEGHRSVRVVIILLYYIKMTDETPRSVPGAWLGLQAAGTIGTDLVYPVSALYNTEPCPHISW